MSLSEYKVYPDVDNLMLELNKYDLFEHVVELEAYGITVAVSYTHLTLPTIYSV